jgi:hypothetical protein
LLGIPPETFRGRQRRGWAQLDGRRLTSEPREFTDGRGRRREEETFLDRDLLALLEPPAVSDGRSEVPGRRPRLNIPATMRALGVSHTTLLKMERAGLLTPERLRSPETGHEQKTYDEAEVKQLRKERAKPLPSRIRRFGNWYIPPREAATRVAAAMRAARQSKRRWRLTRGYLRTLQRWSAEGCVHLGGECLDTTDGPSRGGRTEDWCNEKQIARICKSLRNQRRGLHKLGEDFYVTMSYIRRGLHLSYDAVLALVKAGQVKRDWVMSTVGRGRRKAMYRLKDLRKYLRSRTVPFDGYYPNSKDPENPAYNIARAARESGFTVPFLNKQRAKCRYLPEGKLPSTPQQAPRRRGRNQEEQTVFKKDLDRLKCAIGEALAAGRLDDTWKDAQDLAEHLGISDRAGRILLGSLLREGRRTGKISAQRVWWERRGQRRRVYRYLVEDAVAFLRSLSPNHGGDREKPPLHPSGSGNGPALNYFQQLIVDCLRDNRPMPGKAVAAKLCLSFNSHFRAVLSSLVQRGVLTNDQQEGYKIP